MYALWGGALQGGPVLSKAAPCPSEHAGVRDHSAVPPSSFPQSLMLMLVSVDVVECWSNFALLHVFFFFGAVLGHEISVTEVMNFIGAEDGL